MPNHVINEIIIPGDEAMHARIIAAVADKDGLIDFEVLLPPPLNSWPGNVGKRHTEVFPHNDLDWCAKNWCTKWNAYGERAIERVDNATILRFKTAWRAPYGWMLALWKTLKTHVSYTTLSEGGEIAKTGIFDWEDLTGNVNNDPWQERECDPAEHRRMHKLLWGVESFEDEDEDEEKSEVGGTSQEATK